MATDVLTTSKKVTLSFTPSKFWLSYYDHQRHRTLSAMLACKTCMYMYVSNWLTHMYMHMQKYMYTQYGVHVYVQLLMAVFVC